MKVSRLVLPALFALVLVAAPVAYAESDHHGGDYKGHKGGKGGKMAAHHESIRQMMGMVRETMEIVRDLNHKPSAEDKKKLSAMIDRMDKIIAMSKKMGDMHGGPCSMNPCGGNPCGGMNPCGGNPCSKGQHY